MGRRDRFICASRCQPLDYPPIWMMRQAGRALPEYRELKQRYTFVQLVQNPELATEVTLQPIRRFGFDAAILFSDILVVPEALGQAYHFRETGGIQMDFTIRTAADIDRLVPEAVTERLQYVANALRLIRNALGDKTALLGFAGSPWTLANFMLEGGSSKHFSRALDLLRQDRRLFERLMEILTRAVTDYLRMQAEIGVDALQIFDTVGGLLPPDKFEAGSGRWMRQIVAGLGNTVPVIVFAKGVQGWGELAATGARVIGVDWETKLAEAARQLPQSIAVQGNLNPELLVHATPEGIAAETHQLLLEMRGRPGYIFNLGHGVPPEAKLENIASVIATVRHPL
jgi:uroporphyrinogen decarboxylase